MGKGRCVRWEIGNCRVAAYLNKALHPTAYTPALRFVPHLRSGLPAAGELSRSADKK